MNEDSIKDSQWIQKLYSAGILRESIVAEGLFKELRILTRERLELIEMGGSYVNKMQKCLELMNIKLRNVISQVHGASGLRIIRAIIAGERDPQKLVRLCDVRIKKEKWEDVIKSLVEYLTCYFFLDCFVPRNDDMLVSHVIARQRSNPGYFIYYLFPVPTS